MPIQMVPRFRVKVPSAKQLLPVFKESQLPDLFDMVNIQRAVPQIDTGVEKEEEEEHDLQAAISAHQASVTTGAKIESYIPIPNASNIIDIKEYDMLYKGGYKHPTYFIRFSSTVEDSIGCPYFLDEFDQSFLNQLDFSLSEDDFENIMHQFESITKEKLPHLYLSLDHVPKLDEFSLFHSYPKDKLEKIYGHWKGRKLSRGGHSIFPELKYEETSKKESDPYVCFRRRETKWVRKTRRSDQHVLQRLRTLRKEMEMARSLLEMVLRREKLRKEEIVLDYDCFNKKSNLIEYEKTLGIQQPEEDENIIPIPKKRKASIHLNSTSLVLPTHKIKRDEGYTSLESSGFNKKLLDSPFEDLNNPYQPFPLSIPKQLYKSSSNGIRYRKRVGRGGRVFMDRSGYKIDKRFDSSDEESDVEIDSMKDYYLKYRSQLITEAEIKSCLVIRKL